MTYNIKTYKDYDGKWRAESTAPIGETEEGTRTLVFTTSKVRGGIATSAVVSVYKPDGSILTVIFEDFTKRNIVFTEAKRATEKSIKEVHQYALYQMKDIIEEAKAFYSEKVKENEGAE